MTMTDTVLAPTTVHRNNRIAVALTLTVAAFGASSITSLLAYRFTAEQTISTVGAELRSELNLRKDRVISYLENAESTLTNIASSQIATRIIVDFANAIKVDGSEGYTNMRQAYIANNPNPLGRKQALISANDGSQYSRAHARYHDWLLSLSTTHDFYDLFLIDSDANVVYSVFKEDDFGTNLETGDYRDTALATILKRVRDKQIPAEVVFTDFAAYAPSNNLPAAFMGTPIMRDGQFEGALVAQLKHPRLNNLIHTDAKTYSGMRTYLAGADRYLRAGSGISSDQVLETAVDRQSFDAAFKNRAGVIESAGVRGDDVVSAFTSLRWKDVSWALVVERDKNIINAPVQTLLRYLAIAVLLCSTLAFIIGWVFADRPD